MSIRQPGMQRHHGQLHREGDKETKHDPKLGAGTQLRAQQFRIFEGVNARRLVVDKVECQDGDQHQQSAALRKQEKLDGRVDAPLMAPDDNEEIHRDQHEFPGEIEQEQVDRQEDTCDSRQNPHQVEVEKADFLADFRPGCQHGNDTQEEREHQHQQAETIHSKMEVDAKAWHPIHVHFVEPRPRGACGSAGPDTRGQDNVHPNRDQRDPSRQPGGSSVPPARREYRPATE